MVIDIAAIKLRYQMLSPVLDERGRRRFAASEALAAGRGGIAAVSEATGIARSTIGRGLDELRGKASDTAQGGIRRAGAGRKPLTQTDPTLLADLERIVDPSTRGDPLSPLKWTTKSLSKLAGALQTMGHGVGRDVVGTLLKRLGYSLQANRKTLEGSHHVDRDAQFQHIARTVQRAIEADQPAISVDTKKKELIGAFKNGGREWRPAGSPEAVRVHDFIDPKLGRAAPYGVYDIAADKGWAEAAKGSDWRSQLEWLAEGSVGIDHDTAAFAVNAIRSWWNDMGRERYPKAHSLTITADGGGSNGSRVRLWKVELQKLADELGLAITVLHLPPGTSKWNKIEHRLFSFISRNWRGRPLVDYQTIVELIGATTSTSGLTVRCQLDRALYPAGIKISDAEMSKLNICTDSFHGEWNYTVKPKNPEPKR